MPGVTESSWRSAKTFFPLFTSLVDEYGRAAHVLVVGGSDGKFVLPLARAGTQVTAVDVDGGALLSGENSLKCRVAREGLNDRVCWVHDDIRDLDLGEFDAVWTSCAWHYSHNFDRPLSAFTDAIIRHIKPHGLVGAEYMMPVAVAHLNAEHYLEPGEVWHYFRGWNRLWDAYTSVYIEMPHPGQPLEHVHRMGFLAARKPPADAIIST